MATNLLWFVMAGFLLGFATSTLWEWFYFRKERLKLTDRRIRELEAKLRDAEAETNGSSHANTLPSTSIPTVASVTGATTRTSAWGDSSYRSPGVFLESEERDTGRADETTTRERPRQSTAGAPASVPPTIVPTVNSLAPAASTPSASMAGDNAATLRAESVRQDAPTPADALRAKRNAGPRSRQEVLAALRRNSEAVQRGQFPPPTESEPPLENAPHTPLRDSAADPASEFAHQESLPPTPAIFAAPEPIRPVPSEPPVTPARQRWVDNPELTQRTKEYPDDLTKIKGIGDVYKQRLYRAGIYTWKQIAETDPETLRRATGAYQSSNVEEWHPQAERLMEKHGRRHALYDGPPPDDMTKILGIGPVSASTLYRAGICTYEQLASTSIADLETLFPIAVAGDQPDFAQWVARAAALADEKHASQ